MAGLLATYASLKAYDRRDYQACVTGIDSDLDRCTPEHRQALLFYKANALYHLSRHAEAVRAYRKLLAQEDLNPAYRNNALLNYGMIAVLLDDTRLSGECLDQYRQDAGHRAGIAKAWQGLVRVMDHDGSGWQLLAEGLENPQDGAATRQMLGLACLKCRDLSKAAPVLRDIPPEECESEYLLTACFYHGLEEDISLAQRCITRLRELGNSRELELMVEYFQLRLAWKEGRRDTELLEQARALQARIGDQCPEHMQEIPRLCNSVISQLGNPPTILVSQRHGIVGDSEPIFELRRAIDKYASTDLNVLILGESGTGKELVARALHEQSHRADKNFVAVNCYHLGSNLAEAKLFGYLKGAFSGAAADTIGFVQRADGGTLFLDEIGELPLETQANLFRFLDNGIFYPLGSAHEVRSNVRVIAATNQDLRNRDGFRQELYHRLNQVKLRLPRLVERDQDLRTLAQFRVTQLNRENGLYKTIGEAALHALEQHAFPGNVRELFNTLTSAWHKSGHEILPEHLDLEDGIPIHHESSAWTPQLDREQLDFDALTQSYSRRIVKQIHAECGGNVKQTARRLNMSERSVYRWIQKSEENPENRTS